MNESWRLAWVSSLPLSCDTDTGVMGRSRGWNGRRRKERDPEGEGRWLRKHTNTKRWAGEMSLLHKDDRTQRAASEV